MGQRILSTFLLWTVVLAAIRLFGAQGGVWLVTAISVLTQREFYQMLKRMGLKPFDRWGLSLGAAIAFAPALALYFPTLPPSLHRLCTAENLLALAVVIFSIRILREREAADRVETLAWTLFGLVYVPFLLQFMVRIILIDADHPNNGLFLALWLIAVSKFCDVGALLTGMACGRHKMAPGISPKKTWEGAVGGVLTSGLVGALLVYSLSEYFPRSFTLPLAVVVAFALAALAIVSDLVESIIKRRANLKDSGQAIPGIGGMFDLSDSLILTAPVGYLVFSLL